MISNTRPLNLKSLIEDGALPTYSFSTEKESSYLFSMHRDWSYIELKLDEFEKYLREDGMGYIIAEQERLKERRKHGLERYRRYIKMLLKSAKNRTKHTRRKQD